MDDRCTINAFPYSKARLLLKANSRKLQRLGESYYGFPLRDASEFERLRDRFGRLRTRSLELEESDDESEE